MSKWPAECQPDDRNPVVCWLLGVRHAAIVAHAVPVFLPDDRLTFNALAACCGQQFMVPGAGTVKRTIFRVGFETEPARSTEPAKTLGMENRSGKQVRLLPGTSLTFNALAACCSRQFMAPGAFTVKRKESGNVLLS